MKGKTDSEDKSMFNISWFKQALSNILIYHLLYFIEQHKRSIRHVTFFSTEMFESRNASNSDA